LASLSAVVVDEAGNARSLTARNTATELVALEPRWATADAVAAGEVRRTAEPEPLLSAAQRPVRTARELTAFEGPRFALALARIRVEDLPVDARLYALVRRGQSTELPGHTQWNSTQKRFDDLSKKLATSVSRRQAVRILGAFAVGGLGALFGARGAFANHACTALGIGATVVADAAAVRVLRPIQTSIGEATERRPAGSRSAAARRTSPARSRAVRASGRARPGAAHALRGPRSG
jgi:hypothetical protein